MTFAESALLFLDNVQEGGCGSCNPLKILTLMEEAGGALVLLLHMCAWMIN